MDRGCGENGAETGWLDERDVFTYSGEPLEILFQLTGALDFPQEVGLLLLENGVYGLLGSSFYLMDGWESLLKYDFSDLLILLPHLLGNGFLKYILPLPAGMLAGTSCSCQGRTRRDCVSMTIRFLLR